MYQEDEAKKQEENDDDDDNKMLQNNIDPTVWQLEVERVTPKLKVTIPSDAKEWRTHLSQTRQYKTVIENAFPAAKAQLDVLSREIRSALERIGNKENFINQQFSRHIEEHAEKTDSMKQVQQQYAELNDVVMNYSNEYKNLSEELELVKADMEERSTTVTDTAPIVKMKEAFK